MTPDDAYWDELGVAWRAADSDQTRVEPLLEKRLRRGSFAVAAGLAIGIPLCLAGLALGIFTIWRGWQTGTWNFVTRGMAIGLIAVVLAYALASFRRSFRSRASACALSQMLDMTIARATQTLLLVRAIIGASVLAAVFGLVGTAIRTRYGSAPKLSPIVDLVILALIVLCASLYGRTVDRGRMKLKYLRRTLGQDS